MYRPKQFSLFRYPQSPTAHGGSLSLGKRKTVRPLSVRESMHVVLRAERARGQHSLLLPRHAKMFHLLLKKYGKRFGVKTYDVAVVGNHVHLIVKAKTRASCQNFLRVLPGQVAQRVTGAKPGKPLSKRFWDLIAFTRIIPWGRAFQTAKRYVHKNVLQAAAIIRYSPLTNTS